jgi:hypothetical protein
MPDSSPPAGIFIEGHVYLRNGSGLSGVKIYRRFASYPGVKVAITDQTGYYHCDFQSIPGDEMVSIWAELEGYTIGLKDKTWSWEQGRYSWRHYYGYEERVLDFIADDKSLDW